MTPKRLIRNIVTGTAILISSVPAAENPSRHPLAGTWTLHRANIIQPDGTQVTDPAYGPEAQGLLMIDDTGRYSLQIFRPDRPKFASGNKNSGTAEEFKSAVLGNSTHIGRITVDAANQTLMFQIDYAAFPNWDHTVQKRQYQLTPAGELTYKVPPAPGGITPVSIWRRR